MQFRYTKQDILDRLDGMKQVREKLDYLFGINKLLEDCSSNQNTQNMKKWVDQILDELTTDFIFSMAADQYISGENLPQNLNADRKNDVKQIKTFPEYILHPDRELIANELRVLFKGEKGKSIRLMIEVLKNESNPLITYENRQRNEIYKAMKIFFNWNIGTYQSIWDYKRINDEIDYEAVKIKVLQILNNILNNK